MIAVVASLIGEAAAAVVIAHGAWWSALSLLAMKPAGRRAPSPRRWRFAVLVPAHDEERLIAACVRNLQQAAEGYDVEVLVVADNCGDATAAIAHGHGVRVLERFDGERRGKPFALDFGLAALRLDARAPEAVAIVDADSEVSADFFEAIEARLNGGAQAVQVHYRVAEGGEPLVRLRRLAFLLVHYTRPLGSSRLRLGTTLKGNGMAFLWALVKDGFAGEGITEDAAATLSLAKRGVKVQFEPSASVWGYMAGGYGAARQQDRRWEGGRLALFPRALATGLRAIAQGDIAGAATALEVASLPLTMVAALAGVVGAMAIAGLAPVWAGVAGPVSLAMYLTLGLTAARPARGDLAALREAPRYLAHKAAVYGSLVRSRPGIWERTRRG